MKGKVTLIDYGMGNLQSVRNSCEHLGWRVSIASEAKQLEEAERVILPGVGAFSEGMQQLRARGLDASLRNAVAERVPLLGVCLGMQLLADEGTEGGLTPGLGLVPGRVDRLSVGSLRVPHVGWNDLTIERPSVIAPPDAAVDFYFVHSYVFHVSDPEQVLATCEYGERFAAIVGRPGVWGVQFHPEKSHGHGLRLLKRFLEAAC